MPPKSQPAHKKAKTTANSQSGPSSLALGAPTEDDLPSARAFAPSSSAYSERKLHVDASVPTLVSLCIRVFAGNIRTLAREHDAWEETRQYLKILPDAILTRIFTLLKATAPTVLNAAFITSFFFNGSVMILTSDLPGVGKQTISEVQKFGDKLRELELSGFETFPDSLFASVVSTLPGLRSLVLRGCHKVGTLTMQAAANKCTELRSLNVNYTSVTPLSLVPLIQACGQQLEVLKVAGIPNWTDTAFAKLLAGLGADTRLPSLHTLKLRGTSLTDMSLNPIISMCPSLRHLDISFTLVKHPAILSDPETAPPLEKLSLTSTPMSWTTLIATIPCHPHLKTLSIGALGGGQATNATMGNSSGLTMTDTILRVLVDSLSGFTELEHINLVGNAKLGTTGKFERSLEVFIRRVGRKCKKLNLSGVMYLRSSDLAGLMPDDDEEPSSLEVLNLNNTAVDDQAAIFISTCPYLHTLEVQGTKFTSDGLFTIIDACTRLARLDLTSCRGVRVRDRRRFFEVWKEERADGSS
ncbi:hypothetical protein PC9H_003835 [Pleurotus ostreatus]|uniref:RNI-like protein n=1 Tax=Pleurotus ostreatus TaxID=5322 RepID=A0A8H7DYD1_PLEOS|nr:uncharacterized protein PC9H_003835 [Pleurotus ostreatus]KAF7437001.1 hypothetical protein PC9H_003835 [Pleurotus ostreatus]